MRRDATPRALRLRCELHTDGHQFEAVCLDVGKTAIGMTAEEARSRLSEQIRSFLEESWDTESKEEPLAVRLSWRERLRWHARRLGLSRVRAYVERLAPAEVQELEDRVDLRASEAAEREPRASIPWSEVKTELGL